MYYIRVMKISAISHIFNKKLMPLITTVAMSVPMKTADSSMRLSNISKQDIVQVFNKVNPKDLLGLKIIKTVNFKGGVTYKFDSTSVEVLKSRIKCSEKLVTYKPPIENNKNIYLEPFGMFFANRPIGHEVRPHLGLDIFVSPYSRKPVTPVVVQAPLDGVVISHKKARENDNIISNAITMLGVDGRRYSFDHLARHNDYNDSIPLPKVGTILKAGDKIGYVGATGETTMWHLHLIVMTDKQLEAQKKSNYWLTLSEKTGYCSLSGQVNPLDEKKAGPIAKFLNQYKIRK